MFVMAIRYERSYPPLADILPYLQRIQDRFSEPSLQASFQDFTKTLLFDFPDTKQSYVLTVVNGNATIGEKSIANPDIKVTSNTDVLAGIMDKKVNPITAYMTRKIKVQGAQEDLMRLQKLML